MVYGYVSPEYFCGREIETDMLISALRNGRNVTLMSPRRMGKTGLIHNAFQRISEQYADAACIYVDIYTTSSLSDFVKVFGETVLSSMGGLMSKTKDVLSSVLSRCKLSYSNDVLLGEGKVSIEFKKDDADVTLSDIFSFLNNSGKECFIAIDEFQQIAEYKEGNVEALLRTYVQQYPLLHFVFSGSKSHMMSAMFDSPKRPFFRSTEKMPLGIIPEDAYYAFAEKHLQGTMTVISKEAFHRIYDMFNGHTWYMQYVLNKIYEKSPAVVDDDVIGRCVYEILLTCSDDYKKLYRMLTANQQQLLHAIAMEGSVAAINSASFISKYSLKGSSSINKALQYLIDNEFVYRYDEGYQVYDRFMNLWLQRI